MNEFERYKHLTENDSDILKLKNRIKKIVVNKRLSSLMNDTKWLELQKGT